MAEGPDTELQPAASVGLHGDHRQRNLAIAASLLLAAALGLVIGDSALAVVFLTVFGWLLYLFRAGNEKTTDSLLEALAAERGMTVTRDSSVPMATPLLRRGDRREAPQVLRGDLGDDVKGIVARYRYVHIEKGEKDPLHPFTVGIVVVPESAGFVPHLYCYRRHGPALVEGPELDFMRKCERVGVESAALAESYAFLVEKGQDQNWIRQLFSPTFLVWLGDNLPDKFAFELENGVLCCSVAGNIEDAAELDRLRAATVAIAKRLRDEAAETTSRQPEVA